MDDRPSRAGSGAPSLVMLTQYYPPDPGAASVRLQATARELVRRGWRVAVVTAFPHHLGFSDPRYRGWVREEWDGPVRVVRTWIWPAPPGHLGRRLLNYLSFTVSSLLGLMRVGRADYLLVESPPLFLGATAWLWSVLRGIPYLLSVSDLWPESAVALGLVSSPLAVRLARALERFLYRHAHRILAVTEGIARGVADAGIPRDRILPAPNGVDLERFAPVQEDPELRRALGLEGRHVFLYPGTLGYAQGLEVVVEAADLLRDRSDVAFLLVGDGPVRPALEARVRELGLTNVVFAGLQPVERMPAYFALARAAVVPLRRHPLFAGARPSKLFAAWGAGVPVIFCGEGEAAELVERSGGGVVVPPEDGPALAMAVDLFARLADAEVRHIGAEGRRFVAEHFTWPAIVEGWLGGLGRET
ncbi:MAG: glycosyltransferase family 4 protein [Actinomycetia bacterium]|nr:glycosyltransferase family 4 protein [Actinomycetes bacterium]